MCAVRYRGPPSTGVILRSPASENQTILPVTDNVPLTIKGFAGGLSDLLDIYDTSIPQVLDWKILGSIPGLLSPKGIGAAIGTLQSFLPSGTDTYELFVSGDTQPRLILGQGVFGTQPVPSGEITFGAGGAFAQSVHILASSTGGNFLLVEGFGTLTPGGIEIVGSELGASNVRIQENAGFVQITDTTGTVLFQVGSSGQVQIFPVGGVIPLTIKGFAGGSSDLLDVYRSSGAQEEMWRIDSTGDLIMRLFSGNLTPRIRMKNDAGTILQSVLWRDSVGKVRIFDTSTDNVAGTLLIQGIVQVSSSVSANDFLDFSTGQIILDQTAFIFEGVTYNAVELSNAANLAHPDTSINPAGGSVVNSGLGGFVGFRYQNLSADKAAATIGRAWYNTTVSRLKLDDSSVIRSILDFKNTMRRGGIGVSIGMGLSSQAIVMINAEPDTNYAAVIETNWNTTVWITAKAVGGFTINFGTASPAGALISWMLHRIDNPVL